MLNFMVLYASFVEPNVLRYLAYIAKYLMISAKA